MRKGNEFWFLLVVLNFTLVSYVYSYSFSLLKFKYPTNVNIGIEDFPSFDYGYVLDRLFTNYSFFSPEGIDIFSVTNATIRILKSPVKVVVSSYGYFPKVYYLTNLSNSVFVEDKLEKSNSMLRLVKELRTGYAPKSVEFSPDGQYFLSALLGDRGIDVFSTSNFTKVSRISPYEKFSKEVGFVEILFVKKLGEVWVSQMTTDRVHIFGYPSFEYKTNIYINGTFPKVLISDKDENFVFVSNWASKTISIIDPVSKKVVKKVKVSGVPRGMVVTPNKYLYVCLFEDPGVLEKVNLETYKTSLIKVEKGAKRHIVFDEKRNLIFVSDMKRGSVFVLSYPDDKVIKEIVLNRVEKLNTIKLSPDGKYLFVSSRGPNNPKSYLLKSPVYGKIYVIDTEKLEVVDWIWGRNQPTGLAISPDGKYLAFTDFLDNNIEIYSIGDENE